MNMTTEEIYASPLDEAAVPSLRRSIEKRIYEILDTMDPSGRNTERMRNYLNGMPDRKFYTVMDEFLDNDDKLFPVAYEPYNNPVTMRFVHNVARKLSVPIYEYVYRPYQDGNTEDPPGTVNKIMVLDVPVKRLKQMDDVKNHVSTASSRKDPRTGQVTGEDKTARVTDVEAFSLLAQGQYHAAQELYGPMSDDTEAHYAMLRAIQRDGEVELRDLPNDPLNKVTINTINALMIGSGLQSNLITQNGYVLPTTLRSRDETDSVIDRR